MIITIKAARVNKNLTQEQAAKSLGISVDSLYNYESGRSCPSIKVVQKMVELYGISYDNLNFLPNNND